MTTATTPDPAVPPICSRRERARRSKPTGGNMQPAKFRKIFEILLTLLILGASLPLFAQSDVGPATTVDQDDALSIYGVRVKTDLVVDDSGRPVELTCAGKMSSLGTALSSTTRSVFTRTP